MNLSLSTFTCSTGLNTNIEVTISEIFRFKSIKPDNYSAHKCLNVDRPIHVFSSRKHLRTKVTPDFHLTYTCSKNRGNLGSESK